TIVPFLDTLGRPYQYISIRTEITERKNAELELDKSYRLVSDQNKRLLNFSYIVSHNLRSHASNIKTILRFLQEAESPEEQKMMLQHLETVSERLDETLHNLNEVVSIQRTDQLQLESLNLCEYIEKTCMLLKDQISAKSALIQNRVPADTRVAYNAAYLESILFNLISNAIKYSHPERQSLIQIEWLVHETEKVLQVSDNGVGIDMDKFGDKLFGMYKTFHGNADAKGLGLFIAKNQVEAMGGTISVESAVNQGSVFRVHFPEE
ncbi:MAG: HAMP domain-containing histidine kinase, partial [Bacteroidetes bacterium]|nr:HAMP domain-containing histidine kinase [Bacteroidota bacterium]